MTFTARRYAVCAILVLLFGLPALGADNPPGDLFGRLGAKVKDGQPFQLLVTIRLKPEAEEKFLAEATKAEKASEAEPGCEMYALFKDLEQPGTIILVEKWKSIAALKSHLEQPYIQSLLKLLGELKVEPEIRILNRAAAKSAP